MNTLLQIDNMSFFMCTFLLFVSHFLCDYPLQGDFIAKAKDPEFWPLNGKDSDAWLIILSGHSLIHSFGVFLVTGSVLLSLLQFIIHWIVDLLKCIKVLSFTQDQMIHLATMIVLAALYKAF